MYYTIWGLVIKSRMINLSEIYLLTPGDISRSDRTYSHVTTAYGTA